MSNKPDDLGFRLFRIERMLEALTTENREIITGIVHGRTEANGHPFINLYAWPEGMQQKVTRVYPRDFDKLPDFIPTDVAEDAPSHNLKKDAARRQGLYIELDHEIEIITYMRPTNNEGIPFERRFLDVIGMRPRRRPAEQQPPTREKNRRADTAGRAGRAEAGARNGTPRPAVNANWKLYKNGQPLSENPAEIQAFNDYVAAKKEIPTSYEDLRKWYAENQAPKPN